MLKMDNKGWNQEVLAIKEDLTALVDLLHNNTPDQVGKARKEHLLKHLKRIRSKFLGLSGF